MALNLIMLGPPGAGKGTQAERFARTRGIPKISTGDILREAVHTGTEIGKRAHAIMDRGELLALDTPKALIQQLPGERTLDVSVNHDHGASTEAVSAALSRLAGVERVEQVPAPGGPPGASPGVAGPGAPPGGAPATGPRHFRLYVAGEASSLVSPVVQALQSLGATLDGVNLGEPTLEDVFIHLTGRALR